MTESVQVALIASIPPTLVAIGSIIVSMKNHKKITTVQKTVDGKLSILLENSKAAGKLEGKEEQKSEDKK